MTKHRAWRGGLTLVALAVLGACAPHGAVTSNLGRLPTWNRYLAGDDVRQACEAGGPDRIRFVYNAVWREQVRAYEVAVTDYGARVDQFVWGAGALIAASANGPELAATKASVGIDKARLARLEQAMAESGVDGPAPAGAFLRSDNFYWVVASCRAGRFHFNAFQSGDGRFEALSFPAQLIDADRTGVAVNPPRRLDLPPLAGAPAGAFDDDRPFTVHVSDNGLDVARWD